MNIKLRNTPALIVIPVILIIAIIIYAIPGSTSLPKGSAKINVEVIVETSESMAGYLNGATQFKENISNFARILDKVSQYDSAKTDQYKLLVKSTSFKLLGKDSTKSSNQFISKLMNSNIMDGTSSPLHKMFEDIINNTDSTKATILFSDMIMSFDAKEIKASPEINRDNISTLQHYISSVFNLAVKKNLAVAVFQFSSNFEGTYFDYRNNLGKTGGQYSGNRPYYCMIIANQNLLPRLLKLLKDENFKYDNMISFNSIVASQPHRILKNTDKQGVFALSKDRNHIIDAKCSNADMISFTVGVDLSCLDDSYQKPEFFKPLIIDTCKGIKSKIVSIKEKSKIDLNDKDLLEDEKESSQLRKRSKSGKSQILSLEDCTHFITINAFDAAIKESKISLKIKNKIPDWVEQSSTLDDTKLSGLNSMTTFGLNNLIQGISSAYGIGEILFSIDININTKN